MATINKSINIPIPTGGQRADLDRRDVPLGSAAVLDNWVYREGKFAVRPGNRVVGAALAGVPSRMTVYYNTLGHFDVVVGTSGYWHRWDLSTLEWVDITDPANPLIGTSISGQRFRQFMMGTPPVNYLLGVNGWEDAPRKWNGTDLYFDDIGGSPPLAKCIAACFNRVLLGNYKDGGVIYPMHITVSAFNDFESGWLSTQTVVLGDSNGDLIAMREMGPNIHIYKQDAIYVAIGQAATDPFSFSLYYTGISGPVNGSAVVSLPNIHVFLGSDGVVYTFDGVTLSPLSQSISYHIQNTWDPAKSYMAFGYYDPRREEIIFHYCDVNHDYPNQGVVISRVTGTAWPFSYSQLMPTCGLQLKSEMDITIAEMIHPLSYYTGALDTLGYTRNAIWNCDYTGQVVEESGNDDVGQSIPFSVELGLITPDVSSRDYLTIVESEHLFVPTAGSQLVDVTLGYSDSGEDPVDEALGSEQVNIGEAGPYIVGHAETSRLFTLKISGGATEEVQWRGSLISGVQRGPA